MTINAFVHAEAHNGDPLIADIYQFYVIPRIGEEVVVQEDGKEYILRVTSVGHFGYSKDVQADSCNAI